MDHKEFKYTFVGNYIIDLQSRINNKLWEKIKIKRFRENPRCK